MRKLATLFLLLAGLLAAIAWDADRLLRAPLPLSQPETVEIPPGSSLSAVLLDLSARGLLQPSRLALYTRLYGRATGQAAAIQAGEYELAPGTSPLAMLALFVSGRTRFHALTLIEGWSFAQALSAISAHPMLRHTLAELTPGTVMTAIGRPGEAPEGRLFPDTYRFPKGTTDVDFLKRAAAAMDRRLAEEWAGREPDLPYLSPEEALVMASIVEKETGLASERPAIAGVFVRRLRLGIRLQTDPTVIYGLGASFDGNLRSVDLVTDTPYNTYTREGLPPTPICLPGRAALHAALHPEPGNTLFFVSRGDGSHQFSASLAEHEAAVRRYQLGQP
jgi:UPF0755 protein